MTMQTITTTGITTEGTIIVAKLLVTPGWLVQVVSAPTAVNAIFGLYSVLDTMLLVVNVT